MVEESANYLYSELKFGVYSPKVRWVMPHVLNQMAFVGKDVLAVAHDVYITFLNFRNSTERVYLANEYDKGDGVDVISGHKSYLFAFAEKLQPARIFVVTYPSFVTQAELKDTESNRYKALCMMESDLIAGFSGFPNYTISVWSWRTSQRLISIPTGVVRRTKMAMASRTHMLVCECWGEGLHVWEVAQCYKKTFMLKRVKPEVTGWEVSEPPYVAICWGHDGQLYALDPNSNLYNIQSDGIAMVGALEWASTLKGARKPCMCSFASGLLIYGPDKLLRSLKKTEKSWEVVWQYEVRDEVLRLVGNATCDMAAVWTARGFVYYITGESEDKPELTLFTFKQRNITKIQMIAPESTHLVVLNETSTLCVYEIFSARLALVQYLEANHVSFEASPADPIIITFGEVTKKYGLAVMKWTDDEKLEQTCNMCLTHQIVSRVAFSPTGREVAAAAMTAGHIFILKLSADYNLTLIRYVEVGRGLADCFLMKVGEFMRCFSLVIFSDKYPIGERVICINAETGKDNKFAGKMLGPYTKFIPLSIKDTMLGVPHLSKQYHILKLSGEKGITVTVKMGPVLESGHDMKQFGAYINSAGLLSYGYDGTIVLRTPDAPQEYELKLVATHRYEKGITEALIDPYLELIVHLAGNQTVACSFLHGKREALRELHLEPPDEELFDEDLNTVSVIPNLAKTYLDLQEDKKVREEAMDHKHEREEVIKNFETIRGKLVALLEENIAEKPLHQLSLSEFNLHLEHKKERLKQAEREREEIRLQTEARIRAQDKVTAWIKQQCWDTMVSPRVKLFAIFSHYQVENYAVLPTQREKWPELQQIEALRAVELENDGNMFRPWEESLLLSISEGSQLKVDSSRKMAGSTGSVLRSVESAPLDDEYAEAVLETNPFALSGTNTHRFVPIPAFMIPQTLAFSFLQMNWLQHIVKLNVQNMRLWFNKEFDNLMTLKKREVGLVEERNSRLRFIIEELNKLSDLRGSFHHLSIPIFDPEWKQEEQPQKLIKVEPEECSIEPYISPSQVVVIPPDPGPKDDFKERALIDMMDGVLEKLWHEEIKKPIPKPQCMLEKDPEHFNEDDLRLVFDYEAKVAFRNEERDKYRKMLHAEYLKLSQILNEGVVKFNRKVKETWLLKLKVDSVIGQERLNLMRLRRTNLDRVEMDEKLENMRMDIARFEREVEVLSEELQEILEQHAECGTALESLAAKERYMDRTFKNHFADLSPIIVDQCYKFFKKRPKWHQRATMIPVVLHELATAVMTGVRPMNLHHDCVDFFKGMDQLDLISNMPPVMDEGLWATMCKLRRTKTENEIRIKAVTQEMVNVEGAANAWQKAIHARRVFLARTHEQMAEHRRTVELTARNKTIQVMDLEFRDTHRMSSPHSILRVSKESTKTHNRAENIAAGELVLPAGQVEIVTTGHIEDFEDATLIPREDIEKINNVILKVGEIKLRMMRKQMEFRKGILAKEWEHAQMKMKLRHMEQELYSYQRLKIPKELQLYLKNKELGYTDEQEYVRLEKEMEASKTSVNKILNDQVHRLEDLEVKMNSLSAQAEALEQLIVSLNVKVSEKRLNEDQLEPIRFRRVLKKRMDTLVARSKLIREVQDNYSKIVLLQTELELLRLKTYPTLASFRTF